MVQPLDYHTVGCGGCPAAHPGLEPGHPVPEAGALPITLMGNMKDQASTLILGKLPQLDSNQQSYD